MPQLDEENPTNINKFTLNPRISTDDAQNPRTDMDTWRTRANAPTSSMSLAPPSLSSVRNAVDHIYSQDNIIQIHNIVMWD